MKRVFNISHLYLFLLMFWMLNGVLFTSGGAFARGLLGLIISVSLYYFFYANVKYKLPVYYKALNVLLIMFTIYGLIMMLNGKQHYINNTPVSRTYYLVIIYLSLLPIYASYVFVRKGLLTEKTMRFCVIVFLLLTIVTFFSNQNKLLQKAYDMGSSVEEFTNNVGYSFVGLLPALVLFNKKTFFQYLCMIVCVYFIILGMKRGAILAGGVCLLWFFIVNIKKAAKWKRTAMIIVSVLVVLFGVYFFKYMMDNSYYFQERVAQTEAGDSSGRDEIYSESYQYFINENNPFLFMFGNGADATLEIRRNYAHNDWLEIAINQGVFGLLIYLIYWICFFVSWKKTKQHPQAYMAVGMIFIVYFLLTFFSMSYNSIPRCTALVLGYFMAVSSIEQRPESNEQEINA